MAAGSVLDKSLSFKSFKPNKTEYIKMMGLDQFLKNINNTKVDVQI